MKVEPAAEQETFYELSSRATGAPSQPLLLAGVGKRGDPHLAADCRSLVEGPLHPRNSQRRKTRVERTLLSAAFDFRSKLSSNLAQGTKNPRPPDAGEGHG